MLLYDVQCVFLCISSSVPGRLRQFVLDLHSGKLHREFHHGPDPTDSTPGQVSTHYGITEGWLRYVKGQLICLF